MATGDRVDPYKGFNFRIEINGIDRGGFQECTGLDTTSEPIEYREGTYPLTKRKLAGLVTYSAITLKWGTTDSAELWEWRTKTMEGKVERKEATIILMDDAGEEKLRWNLEAAWPSKWVGPTFNAGENSVAVETLELAHEGVTKG